MRQLLVMWKSYRSGLPARVCPLAFLGALFVASSAEADVTFFELFKKETFVQTSNAQPSAPAAFEGAADMGYNSASQLSSAQVTVASPLSPITLNRDFPTANYSHFSQTEASAAALDTDFPDSATYTYSISGGTLGTHSATLTTPASSQYPLQVPYLNGTAYSDLQGMDSTAPFQFTFDGFTPPGVSGFALMFMHISRATNGQVDYIMSGTNTLTSLVAPAHTLQPNTAYNGDLFYRYFIMTNVFGAGFSGAHSQVEYDLDTHFTFTTAVPEPTAFFLAAVGFIGLGVWDWRRRQRFPKRPPRLGSRTAKVQTSTVDPDRVG
jgi:hypothetical protein